LGMSGLRCLINLLRIADAITQERVDLR
jgi:hypothetical protein